MTTVANTLIELNRWMTDIVAHAPRAERNIRDASPGYPTTTPGNGSPGGGSSGTTGSIVERLALNNTLHTDTSLTDAARLRLLVQQLEPLIRETRDICLRYGYSTAGEYENNPRRRPTTDSDPSDGKWCQSCARLQTMEPVGPKGRRNLCRWCADFQDAEGLLPPLTVLDHRHRGGRMSTVFVTRQIRIAKAATKKTTTIKRKGAA